MPPVRRSQAGRPIPLTPRPKSQRAASFGRTLVEGEECCICFGDLTEKMWVQLMPCRHFYHASCAREWMETRETKNDQTCPLCRTRTTVHVDERGESSPTPFPFGITGKPTQPVLKRHPQPGTLHLLLRDTEEKLLKFQETITDKSDEYIADYEAEKTRLRDRLVTLQEMKREWQRGEWEPPVAPQQQSNLYRLWILTGGQISFDEWRAQMAPGVGEVRGRQPAAPAVLVGQPIRRVPLLQPPAALMVPPRQANADRTAPIVMALPRRDVPPARAAPAAAVNVGVQVRIAMPPPAAARALVQQPISAAAPAAAGAAPAVRARQAARAPRPRVQEDQPVIRRSARIAARKN